MIEFILKYWLEIFFTIISSSVGYMIKGYMSLKSGLKALLKNEIIRIYEKYMELGYCPNYMKESFFYSLFLFVIIICCIMIIFCLYFRI